METICSAKEKRKRKRVVTSLKGEVQFVRGKVIAVDLFFRTKF